MKYEEIKIGESYLSEPYIETVIFKHDKTKSIVCEDKNGEISIYNSDEYEYLKPLKEELPEEGLLVGDCGSLVYKLSDGSGYGFGWGSQSNYCFNEHWRFSNVDYWKPATPEQESKFIEMLKKECEKHGLFEDTKIENHANVILPKGLLNKGDYGAGFIADRAWNKNGQIFYKGKFATPLKEEEPTLKQVINAVKEIGDFTIEQTESGVIILNPIKK